MIAEVAGAKADEFFKHGDKIKFGKYEIECRSTPGHTNGEFSESTGARDNVFNQFNIEE